MCLSIERVKDDVLAELGKEKQGGLQEPPLHK
jgi:hypothetical protein